MTHTHTQNTFTLAHYTHTHTHLPLPLQASLTPISAAFEMDPVERALRVGGEREAAKRTEEDAGTIAGVCIDNRLMRAAAAGADLRDTHASCAGVCLRAMLSG